MLIYTHLFNSPLCATTRLSPYEKGKTNLDFTEARDSEWQWHQLGRMQVCTSLQTDNHASTHHSVFTGRMPFLPPNQQRQSTEGKQLLTELRHLFLTFHFIAESRYSALSLVLVSIVSVYCLLVYHMLVNERLSLVSSADLLIPSTQLHAMT